MLQLFALAGLKSRNSGLKGVGPYVGGQSPLPVSGLTLTGVSRDSTGAPLGGVTCSLFQAVTSGPFPVYTHQATTVSDDGGNYSFIVGTDGPFRVLFDLPGAPSTAGVTLPTLSGV